MKLTILIPITALLLTACGDEMESRVVCDSDFITPWVDFRTGRYTGIDEGIIYFNGKKRKMIPGEVCWRERRSIEQ